MTGFDRTTWVVTLQSGLYRARCTCDWTGQLRASEAAAQQDANRHAAQHQEPLPYPEAA